MNHLLKSCAVSAAALAVAMLTGCTSPKGEPQTFEIGNKEFLLNGKPFLIKAAEIHYTRIPAEYWEHRIEMCKALGMNTICIYAFWNIHEQRPDSNVLFVVGNNDLDFYRFLNENGGLPDIITCCRFSLHDASPLKDSLMDLSTTNAAGAVYDTYLSNFMNEDGSVNWLPVCADAHGFVVNKDLFEKYDIPLPTDYESFVSACQAFDEVGIRGVTADYYYDYTCMETLQGLSISELSSVEGRKWRTVYSDSENTKREGLDSTVWPEAFERMEQFIQDTGLSLEVLNMNYVDGVEMYKSGKLAMYFGSSFGVKMFQDQGINTTFLPFFQENGEKWIMTTPYFQVALNRELTKDESR